MSYSSLIKSSKEKVYNHAIATKILDLMDKLRMSDNETSKRRWVWELIQNAKDTRFLNMPIDIEIDFVANPSRAYIEFRHNGQPFTIDNITFLIEQVSTKDRHVKQEPSKRTTGKFGTGFLTTHLLSEIVEIESFVKEENLPYKHFHLKLDRSGRTIEEIIQSVQLSLEVLGEIEIKDPATNYDETLLNTKFRYHLNDEGVGVAEEGLTDLDHTLPYTMVFLPEIQSVYLPKSKTRYLLDKNHKELNANAKVFTIEKKVNNKRDLIHIVTSSTKRVTIAFPITSLDSTIVVKKLSEHLPKLYCDFPLIGTENFNIPFIINSAFFNPNEPRNGIFLTDRKDERIEENKELIKEAIDLYDTLLEYASTNNWRSLYNLGYVNDSAEKEWLSTKWYDENIIEPIRKSLVKYAIVDTQDNNRISILNKKKEISAWFPYAAKKEVREKIWDLCYQWIPSIIPVKEEVDNWYDILWPDCGKITVKSLTAWIGEWGNVATVEEKIDPTSVFEWLNEFYDILNMEGKVLEDVMSDKYAIIPNQRGDFKKMTDLVWDKGIEEPLKDVIEMLGEDIRSELRHLSVRTNNKYNFTLEDNIRHRPRKPDDVVTRINKLIVQDSSDKAFEACIALISLFSNNQSANREQLYNFCNLIFPDHYKEKTFINYDDPSIWIEADKKIISFLAQEVSSCQNINTFCERYRFETEKEGLEILNTFISFLKNNDHENLLNISDQPLLPNQNGDFVEKDSLFLDDGNIDESLKDICEMLGYEIRKEMLDKAIFLEISENRTYTQNYIADKITTLILPRLSELTRTNETREAFRTLYLWFRDNKELASSLFSELYNARHKLYDDEEVADSMIKAEGLRQLMDEFNISDLDDLRRRIISSNNQIKPTNNETQPLTQDVLVSLGIGSKEEFIEAFKDGKLAEKFTHTSIPTYEMFVFAQSLIERAKENILNFLQGLSEYDCSEAEETAPTIISGIKHNGRSIDIVARPSDNGEVIIYYESEKDILELNDSELWIDNGVEKPRQLTLGKILKVTGINRIPVK